MLLIFVFEGGYFPDGVGGKPWVDSDPNAVNSFYNAKVFFKIFEVLTMIHILLNRMLGIPLGHKTCRLITSEFTNKNEICLEKRIKLKTKTYQ